MQDELRKMEEIRERLDVSYEEAYYALEEAEGDVAKALAVAERDQATEAAGLAAAGTAFYDELMKFGSAGKVRGLRLRWGTRILAELPLSPRTTLATLGIAVAAIVITKLRIEVQRESEPPMRELAPRQDDLGPAPGYETE